MSEADPQEVDMRDPGGCHHQESKPARNIEVEDSAFVKGGHEEVDVIAEKQAIPEDHDVFEIGDREPLAARNQSDNTVSGIHHTTADAGPHRSMMFQTSADRRETGKQRACSERTMRDTTACPESLRDKCTHEEQEEGQEDRHVPGQRFADLMTEAQQFTTSDVATRIDMNRN